MPDDQPDNGLDMLPVPSHQFTQRKRALLLTAFKDGQTVRGACARAGISTATFYDHVNSEPEFALQVNRAKGEGEARLVDAVREAAHTGETVTAPGGKVTVKPGDWRAAAWLLEHHPDTRERYAAIHKQQVSGDPDNPTPVAMEVVNDGMSTMERMAAVVNVLQRAGVVPIPGPGDSQVIDVTPEAPPDHGETGAD